MPFPRLLVIPQLLIDKLFDPLSSSYLFVVSVRVTLRSRSGRHDRVDTNRLIRYVLNVTTTSRNVRLVWGYAIAVSKVSSLVTGG